MTASDGQQQIEPLDSIDNPTGVRKEVAAVEPQLAEIQAALATLRSDIEARIDGLWRAEAGAANAAIAVTSSAQHAALAKRFPTTEPPVQPPVGSSKRAVAGRQPPSYSNAGTT